MAYMTYNELDKEKAKPLAYKEEIAAEVIGKAFKLCKSRAALAFSGGKDSTVLWHLIRKHYPEEAKKIAVIYGNTGVEFPERVKNYGDIRTITNELLRRDGIGEITVLSAGIPCQPYSLAGAVTYERGKARTVRAK